MRQQRFLAMLWMGVCLLAGCAGSGDGPEPLPLDRVNCATCTMLISDLANAGQVLVPGEETRFYDDIGCLAKGPAAAKPGARLFVRLANGTGWGEVDRLWFAITPAVRTPMGYGITAFLTEPEARRADINGSARDWKTIVARMRGR